MTTTPNLIVVVLGALLAISELLPFTPFKSNGVVQGIVNMLKSIYNSLKGTTPSA